MSSSTKTVANTNTYTYTYPATIHLDAGVVLDKDDPHAPAEIAGLPDVTLMPHQQVILAWLISVAKNRVVTTSHNARVLTNSAWLYLAYGAGKTYIILSFILHWLQNDRLPVHPTAIVRTTGGHVNQLLTAQYAKLTPAFIFVGIQVYEQWLGQIAKTNKRVFALRDAEALKRFIPLVASRDINKYDIVLVKNGNVQGSDFNLPGEEPGDDFRPMISALIAITSGLMLGLIVCDDFDTSQIWKGATLPNAAFSLFVSASESITCSDDKVKRAPRQPKDIFDALLMGGLPRITSTPMSDKIFSGMFRATVRDSYIKIVPPIWHRLVVLTTREDTLLHMMKYMGDDGKQIAELLNGGANNTAASVAKCVAKTAGGIFGMLIGRKEAEMKKASRAKRVLSIIDALYIRALPPGNGGTDPRRVVARVLTGKVQYPRAEVDALHDIIQKGVTNMETKKIAQNAVDARNRRLNANMLEKDEVLYNNERLVPAVTEGLEQANAVIAEIEPRLRKLREDLCKSDCIVCQCKFDEDRPMSINKCCGAMLCGPCGAACSECRHQLDARTGQMVFAGKCPKCRSPLTSKSIIILRNPSLLKQIEANDDIAEQLDEEEEAPEENISTNKNASLEHRISQIENEKIRCLVMIMFGIPIPQCRDANIKFKNMLGGGARVPQQSGIAKKVLVVANVEETHIAVKKAFDEFGIKYYRHAGTTHDRDKIVCQFREDEKSAALLVTAPHTSGMDLPFLTDTVLMHWILDMGLLGQVVGRGQRIIRTDSSLNVYYLVYENEVVDVKMSQD